MANLLNKCFYSTPTCTRSRMIRLKPYTACKYLATTDDCLKDFFSYIPAEYFDGRWFDPDDVDFYIPRKFEDC